MSLTTKIWSYTPSKCKCSRSADFACSTCEVLRACWIGLTDVAAEISKLSPFKPDTEERPRLLCCEFGCICMPASSCSVTSSAASVSTIGEGEVELLVSAG